MTEATSGLTHSLAGLVEVLGRAVVTDDQHKLVDTMRQIVVLHVVREAKEPLTIKQTARLAKVAIYAADAALDYLVTKELVGA
jgi:hypothetical protein